MTQEHFKVNYPNESSFAKSGLLQRSNVKAHMNFVSEYLKSLDTILDPNTLEARILDLHLACINSLEDYNVAKKTHLFLPVGHQQNQV